jgi:cellulose synthase/poly-beta-1,6-N-acetylglucosamine synthase-like glycosyltransferase
MVLAGFISGIMALTLLVIGGIYRRGRRYIHQGDAANYRRSSGPWPRVAVIIPVAGVYPGLKENLRSRLTQDYPQYQVVFATRSEDDPATGVIKTLVPDFSQTRLVVTGPASGCGQKNHNLLVGLKAVEPEVEILVFSDANQAAPAHWLQALVQPLVQGEAVVSSSFHHIIPQDSGLATLGRSFSVFMIYLGKGISPWDQPWGGSTAIRREVFHELEVNRLWSRTVVDDVSLAKKLQSAGVRVVAATGAVLATPAAETMAGWEDWFTRQLLYLKFYFPFPWAMAGVGIFFLLGLVLLSIGQLVLAAMGSVAWGVTGLSGVFLLILTTLAASLRSLHPRPGPWLLYLTAGYLTLAMAAWCHTKTWFTRKIRWRSLVYRVDGQGIVTGIQEDSSVP